MPIRTSPIHPSFAARQGVGSTRSVQALRRFSAVAGANEQQSTLRNPLFVALVSGMLVAAIVATLLAIWPLTHFPN